MANKTQSLTIRLEGDNKGFDQALDTTLGVLNGLGATVGSITEKLSTGIEGGARVVKILTDDVKAATEAVQALGKAYNFKLNPGVNLNPRITSSTNPLKEQEKLGEAINTTYQKEFKFAQDWANDLEKQFKISQDRKNQLYSEELKEAEAKQKASLAIQREQALNGSNTLVELKLKEAESIRLLEVKKYKDLEDIQRKFLSGQLNYIQQGTERNKILVTYGTGVSSAQRPVNTFIQRQTVESDLINQAKIDSAQLKAIQSQQLAEMQRQVNMERTIKINGKLGDQTIELKAAQDKQRINENLTNNLNSLSDQVKNRVLTNAQAQIEASKAIATAQKQLTNLPPSREEQSRVQAGFGKILKTVWDYYVAYQAVNIVVGQFREILTSIIPAGIALDATRSSLLSTVGSAGGAESALKALRIEASRTGIEIGSVRSSFKLFQASTSLAGASLKDTWKMFTNMNNVITALHLTTDDANGVFLALAQIFNKSKVQSEELVKQLGNLLPGAFASFAASMNITTEELTKRMKDGTVYARDTMLDFTKFMSDRFSPSFAAASQLVNADINRMKTSFTLIEEALYNLSNRTIQRFVQSITGMSESVLVFIEDTNRVESALNLLNTTIQTLAVGSLVAISTKLVTLTMRMGEATLAANLYKVALAFISSPAVIIAGIYAVTKALPDMTLSFDDSTRGIEQLIKKTAELKAQQNLGLAGELNLSVENDPQLKVWKDKYKEVENLQKATQERINKAKIIGALNPLIVPLTTETRNLLLNNLDEIRTTLEKNKSLIRVPIEFDTRQFLLDVVRTGNIGAEVYVKFAEAEKAYIKIQENGVRENNKEQRLAAKIKEGQAEIESRLKGKEKVQESEIFKAKANQLDLAIQISKEEGNQLKVRKLMEDQLNLNKQAEAFQVEEKKREGLNAIEASEGQLQKREEAQQKRKEALAKGLLTDIPEASRASLEADIKIREDNKRELLEIDQLQKGDMAKIEAKYRQDIIQLNKQFSADNSQITSQMEKMAQLSIKRFADQAKSALAELSMQMQDFEWAVEEQTTGLSIDQIGKKRLEYAEKEAQLSINQLNNAINTTLEVGKQVKLLQTSEGKYKATPELINAIIDQESAGNPNAVSPKGAAGLMQIMPATAKNPGYGITPKQNNSTEENIRFGTDYVNALLNVNKGNVPFTLAAYNAGQGSVDKAGGIPNIPETKKYVSNIMGKLSKEDIALAKEESQVLKDQEGIAQKLSELEKKKQQIRHQTVVELRDYSKIIQELEAARLEFEGKYEEASKIRFESQFKRNRTLIQAQNEPQAIADFTLSEKRAVVTDKIARVYKEINSEAENLKEEELRINQAKDIGLINEFQAMSQLTDKRKEYVDLAYKNISAIEKESGLLSKEQKDELQREKDKINSVKYPNIGYNQKYLEQGNSLGSVNFISEFSKNSDAIPNSQKEELASIGDKNNTKSYIANIDAREKAAQDIVANSTLAQGKNYASLFQGTFALGSQFTQALLDQEVAAHGVRSSQARKAFALNKAIKIAEASMAMAKGIVEALGSGPIIGPIMATIIGALGAMQIAQIASQQMPSAHSGLTNVPETGTYILKSGERVLAPEQNKDLTQALRSNVYPIKNPSSQTTVNHAPTVNVNVTTNNSDGQAMGEQISAAVVRALAKSEIELATRQGNVIYNAVRKA